MLAVMVFNKIAWAQQEPEYADALKNDPYHELRLNFVEALIPSEPNLRVIDFGCGEGVLSRKLALGGAADVIGIDPSADLIENAKSGPPLANARYLLGSVEQLRGVLSGTIDLILVINVLAYMSADEEHSFYTEAKRVLSPGGSLVVTHSNELFDLFTLNNLTVEFFDRHFGSNVEPLLAEMSKKTAIETYGIRENPLSYPAKLAAFGFAQQDVRFFHNHPTPPLLQGTGDKRNIVNKDLEDDALNRNSPLWTDFFKCSTFGVRATKSHS